MTASRIYAGACVFKCLQSLFSRDMHVTLLNMEYIRYIPSVFYNILGYITSRGAKLGEFGAWGHLRSAWIYPSMRGARLGSVLQNVSDDSGDCLLWAARPPPTCLYSVKGFSMWSCTLWRETRIDNTNNDCTITGSCCNTSVLVPTHLPFS